MAVTSALILPGAGYGVPRKRSSLLVHWRASDLSLNALTGQQGTFGRGSPASSIDTDGLIYPASMDQPRWMGLDTDGDGVRDTVGLLCEGQRTNLLIYSESFDQVSAWGVSGTSIVPNYVTTAPEGHLAPDGTATADILAETAAAGVEHYVGQYVPGGVGITDNAIATASVHAGYTGSRSKIYLSIVQKDGSTVKGAFFDVANGVVISRDAGVAAEMEYVERHRFWRCWVTMSVGAGGSAPGWRVQTVDASNHIVFNGVLNSGLYIWGAQFELGAHASSYIKTLGTAVTRAADLFTMPAGTVQPLNTWTLYIRGVSRAIRDGADYFVLIGTVNPVVVLAADNNVGNYITGRFTDAGGASYDAPGNASAPRMGDLFDVALQYTPGATNLQYSLNGGAATGNTPSAPFTPPDAWGGSDIIILSGNPGIGSEGFYALISAKVASGTRSLDQMRSAF